PITRVVGRRLCWILYHSLTRPLKRKPTHGLEVCTGPPYHVLERQRLILGVVEIRTHDLSVLGSDTMS
ncbi:unnamed protein product, partial [Linum tenue]